MNPFLKILGDYIHCFHYSHLQIRDQLLDTGIMFFLFLQTVILILPRFLLSTSIFIYRNAQLNVQNQSITKRSLIDFCMNLIISIYNFFLF